MSASFSCINTVTGTANQINATPGNLNPVFAISNNPIFPGTAGATLPTGTTGQRGGAAGTLRFNTTTTTIEGTLDGATWVTVAGGIGPILSISGTLNRITVSPGVNPVIDIDAAYVGQASITTLGTITTGTWSATAIGATHGGTSQTTYILGDTLYASAANTLSKLAGNITAGIQYLAQTGTGAVSAAPVWTTISGGDISGAALTKTDDTNVTLTLGGTPATSLLRAASLTLGWTGQLSLARGGSNANLTASNGGIVWSNATQMQILSGTATANQMLQSGATATPAWSTATWPATTTINQLLYSSAANTVVGLATGNNGVLITSAGGAPSISSTLPATVQGNITAVGALASGSLAAGFTPVTVPIGGTGNTTFTAYSVICAGTTATGTMQNVVGLGTAGQVLTSAGAAALPTWSSNAAANGRLVSFQFLTSGTAATYTKPAGVSSILVECVGGGGAGGSASASAGQFAQGGGGGAGGYCRLWIASSAATYTYTIGAGGTPGAAGNNPGGNGAATTFSGSTLSAGGGTGGSAGASNAIPSKGGAGGSGGSASNGDINFQGNPGLSGVNLNNGGISGAGGGSFFGGAAAEQFAGGTAGIGGSTNSGSGGSGANSTNGDGGFQGGAGAAGIIIVWEFS